MKLPLLAALGLCLAVPPAGAADEPAFKTDKEKASYSIGFDLGKNLKGAGVEVDLAAVAAGIKDGSTGATGKLTEQEMMAAMQLLQKEVSERRAAKAGETKAEGAKFLAANGKKEGVKTTASGLQYKVIKDGTGKTPKDGDTVTTHYKGTFIDGNEFDSSYKRNEPATFPVNGVIKGWTEALKLMKEGAKWQLYIPSDLAYGPQGRPGIPPDSMLIFDIELIKVDAK
jgi:FKBP-type peptidyl-prolyl cis-trans isomerase FklB